MNTIYNVRTACAMKFINTISALRSAVFAALLILSSINVNAQLENGVITANDFLREVNAEDQARLSLITHRLQWLQAQINHETISGNQ